MRFLGRGEGRASIPTALVRSVCRLSSPCFAEQISAHPPPPQRVSLSAPFATVSHVTGGLVPATDSAGGNWARRPVPAARRARAAPPVSWMPKPTARRRQEAKQAAAVAAGLDEASVGKEAAAQTKKRVAQTRERPASALAGCRGRGRPRRAAVRAAVAERPKTGRGGAPPSAGQQHFCRAVMDPRRARAVSRGERRGNGDPAQMPWTWTQASALSAKRPRVLFFSSRFFGGGRGPSFSSRVALVDHAADGQRHHHRHGHGHHREVGGQGSSGRGRRADIPRLRGR